jgi:heat shock protein HtpX
MATLYTHKDSNIRKTWGLMAGFLVLVLAVGFVVAQIYGAPEILYIAVVIALVTNFVSYWYSDKIVIGISGAKPATRAEYFDLWNAVENLAITAGLPMPKVYIVSDEAPNAFATGRNPEHAVVAVTTGLLSMLSKNELEGVIAHELSHIGNRDILLSTVAVVLAGLLALVSDFFLRMSFFGGGRDNDSKGGNVMAIVGLILIVLSPIAATLLRMSISRKREFLADASGALLTRYPEGLASALQKIDAYSGKMRKANHATAHLYISNPFGRGKTINNIDKMFSTHPPMEERVKALTGKVNNNL